MLTLNRTHSALDVDPEEFLEDRDVDYLIAPLLVLGLMVVLSVIAVALPM